MRKRATGVFSSRNNCTLLILQPAEGKEGSWRRREEGGKEEEKRRKIVVGSLAERTGPQVGGRWTAGLL